MLYVINEVGYVAHQFHFALLLLSYKMVFHASIDRSILFPTLILYRVTDVLVASLILSVCVDPILYELNIGHNGLWSLTTITSGAPTR